MLGEKNGTLKILVASLTIFKTKKPLCCIGCNVSPVIEQATAKIGQSVFYKGTSLITCGNTVFHFFTEQLFKKTFIKETMTNLI